LTLAHMSSLSPRLKFTRKLSASSSVCHSINQLESKATQTHSLNWQESLA